MTPRRVSISKEQDASATRAPVTVPCAKICWRNAVDRSSRLISGIVHMLKTGGRYRKGSGQEAKLSFIGHALMENRSGLLVDTCLTQAGGHAGRVAALALIEPRAERRRAVTLGAGRGYDAADFVNEPRTLNVHPHGAQNTSRRSTIDGCTTRHPGYGTSQQVRKRIEEAFGWTKSVGGLRRPMLRGLPR